MDFTELYKSSNYLCSFSPSSSHIATAVEHRVVIRDAETLQIQHLFSCSEPVSEVLWSPHSDLILCASYKAAQFQVWGIGEGNVSQDWTACIDEGNERIASLCIVGINKNVFYFGY